MLAALASSNQLLRRWHSCGESIRINPQSVAFWHDCMRALQSTLFAMETLDCSDIAALHFCCAPAEELFFDAVALAWVRRNRRRDRDFAKRDCVLAPFHSHGLPSINDQRHAHVGFNNWDVVFGGSALYGFVLCLGA